MDPAREPERAGRRGAALAAALVLLACLGVVALTPSQTYWIVDCGNKALLSQRLLDTGFGDLNLEHPGASIDPRMEFFPARRGFAIRRGEGFASLFPPAYPALAAPFLALLGPAGLRVPAALGVAACALLFACWAAPAVGWRWAVTGGAALGLATPLFFYGVTVWEHAIGVALCLGAWLALARAQPRGAAAAGFLVGCACWLREELALMGLALAVACLLHPRRLRLTPALLAGALPPLTTLLAFNAWAYAHPLGPHVPVIAGAHPLGALGALIEAPPELGRQALAILGGYGTRPAEAAALGGAALAALGGGALAARRRRAGGAALGLALAAGLGSWLTGIVRLASAQDPLFALVRFNGLMVQMPLAGLAGIGWVRVARDPAYAGLRIGATAGALFAGLALLFALLSQQAIFGVHWGPRWLLPAAPALVLFAIAALRRGDATPPARRLAWAALIAAGLLSSALATWFLAQQKRDAERLQNAILELPTRAVATGHPFLAEHLAALWQRKPVFHALGSGEHARLIRLFRRSGVREFLAVVAPGRPPHPIAGWRCRLEVEHRGPHLRYLDLDVHRCRRQARRNPRVRAGDRP